MKLYRIANAGPGWKADDLTGNGAALYPGRWNREGEHVVYAATSLALAVLETAAHIDVSGLPIRRSVVEITVPEPVWALRSTRPRSRLPEGWDAIPSTDASRDVGSRWYMSGASAVLVVPSVIVPEESSVLINATHAQSRRIKGKIVREFDYDRLFRR